MIRALECPDVCRGIKRGISSVVDQVKQNYGDELQRRQFLYLTGAALGLQIDWEQLLEPR